MVLRLSEETLLFQRHGKRVGSILAAISTRVRVWVKMKSDRVFLRHCHGLKSYGMGQESPWPSSWLPLAQGSPGFRGTRPTAIIIVGYFLFDPLREQLKDAGCRQDDGDLSSAL